MELESIKSFRQKLPHLATYAQWVVRLKFPFDNDYVNLPAESVKEDVAIFTTQRWGWGGNEAVIPYTSSALSINITFYDSAEFTIDTKIEQLGKWTFDRLGRIRPMNDCIIEASIYKFTPQGDPVSQKSYLTVIDGSYDWSGVATPRVDPKNLSLLVVGYVNH